MVLSQLDIGLLVAYFLAVAWIGWHTSEREHDTRGYLLGNRGIPWWAVLMSIVGTEISALTFVGVPALAYTGNWAYVQLALGTILARMVVSRWFVPAYYRGNVVSIYEFLGKRFGPITRSAGVAVFLLTRVMMSGVRLFAGAILVKTAFGLSGPVAIILVAVLGTVYTIAGGIKAVVWTEVLQVTVMFGGALMAGAVLLHGIPGGLAAVHDIVGPDRLQILDFRYDPSIEFTIWTALIATTLTNTAIFGTDYDMVQRMLTAKDSRRSQWAVIGSGLADVPIALLFLGLGTLLYAYYHVHPDPTLPEKASEIFPHFILTALPHGLVGLVTAAVLSVVLSSFESALNALAGSFVVDVYQPWIRREAPAEHYVAATRLATIGFSLAMVAVALYSQGIDRILELGLEIGTYTYGALLAVFALGLFTKRGSDRSAALGIPFSIAAVLLAKHYTTLAFPWFVTIGTVVGMAASLALEVIDTRQSGPSSESRG